MKISKLQARVDENRVLCWTISIFVGFAVRFLVLYFTDNDDFIHFCNTASLAVNGKNVYANTVWYNYGPLLFTIIKYFYAMALHFQNSILIFKIIYVAFLAFADLMIAKLIGKKTGDFWGMLFFINPISMVIDGYHTQFDNIAVMFGAYAVYFLEKSSHEDKIGTSDVYGIALLSLSLITKHVLWAFPLYILFNKEINRRKKYIYAFIPPIIFLLSFIPYWGEGADGIIHNVFMYRSFRNFPLLFVGLIQKTSLNFLPNSNVMLFVFAVLMLISAYLFRYEHIFNLFLVYTMAVLCFSSGASGQQLVIPCMAMIMLFHERAFFYFFCIATRLLSKQFMLTSMAWCVAFYLLYYYCKKRHDYH